eukprot:CAMPEP_0196601780 /NCGR_PEP_ID=MMETSP1081-20130531/96085_1 /TAXON_ID=36882 /ORGANISM="Pyramimonas amylifera, Strain CCMP720" /LENGTH=52 /DNA_ID=CAMNT_0041927671 /DNA_START=1909 /DNA_END=2068 /DNA_ORIENTATION=+
MVQQPQVQPYTSAEIAQAAEPPLGGMQPGGKLPGREMGIRIWSTAAMQDSKV